jgi:hypothetical protein
MLIDILLVSSLSYPETPLCHTTRQYHKVDQNYRSRDPKYYQQMSYELEYDCCRRHGIRHRQSRPPLAVIDVSPHHS